MVDSHRRRSCLAAIASATLLAALSSASPSSAEPRPTPTANEASTAEQPLRVQVIAPSADPPWTLHVENTGTQPVRIPADVRLLELSLEHGPDPRARAASAVRCELPRSLRPSRFPEDRALVLAPGEVWRERFDPRLFCFGANADRLRGGALVRARFGWKRSPWRKPSEPFVAQSLESPEAFEPLQEVWAPSFVLAFRRSPDDQLDEDHPPGHWVDGEDEVDASVAAARSEPRDAGGSTSAAPPTSAPATPTPATPSRDGSNGSKASSRPGEAAPEPSKATEPPSEPSPTDAPAWTDANAGRVDIFVRRYADAHAARDVVVTIDAVNEGQRSLEAVLRGRMLSFTVEELGRSNRAKRSVSCQGTHKPHAIASESVQRFRPGQKASIPVLLAEVCPRGTFARPGLYRVLPYIDTSVEGEAREERAYVGQALAKQSALVRVATGSEPFAAPAPRAARRAIEPDGAHHAPASHGAEATTPEPPVD